MEIKEEMQYWRNTLQNFYLLKKEEKMLNQEILRLDIKIEEERIAVHGMNYEGSTAVVGDGCSVHYAKCQPADYNVNKQVELNAKAKKIIEKREKLDKINLITERFRNISTESQMIINYIYQREMTLDEVARMDEDGVSKTTIKNRLDKALMEMIEAC